MLRGTVDFDAVGYLADRAGPLEGSAQEWVARAELAAYTSSQLLRDSDVMSMAHSLELRVPLLDARLVDTVSALPPSVRFQRGRPKALLREIMQDQLPRAVLDRRERRGFIFPLQHWLRQDEARSLWQFDAPIMQHFNRAALGDLRERFHAGRAHWSRAWALMALNEWSRRSAHA
jgi:asparagine synthase (glutamine-hydrolysing)